MFRDDDKFVIIKKSNKSPKDLPKYKLSDKLKEYGKEGYSIYDMRIRTTEEP